MLYNIHNIITVMIMGIILIFSVSVAHSVEPDINTILMNSTFKIKGEHYEGTAFILGVPIKDKGLYSNVLVTAAHVLESIPEDRALLELRKVVGNTLAKFDHPVLIRKNGKALWVKHPEADVAVIYIALPPGIEIMRLSSNLLATDNVISEYEISPGSEVFTLGYPFGELANEYGFPILKSGKIASFPLLPTKTIKTFLVDFIIFSGNSGGPVYFYDRDWHKRGSYVIRGPIEVRMILGLVAEEKTFDEVIKSYNKQSIEKHNLGIAVVVHSSLIKETIDMLPPLK